MNTKWIVRIILLLGLWVWVTPSVIFAKGMMIPSKILAYGGKTFTGFQDPEYLSYDRALREYLIKRIDQTFGVLLDPGRYSGFDLLEIESLFKLKKSDEPFDLFLKMFPKNQ